MFVVCAAYLAGSYLIKPDLQPDWVRDAYLIGPVQEGARRIEASAARGLPATPARGPPPADRGAARATPTTQRQALEKLVSPQP